MKPEYTMIQRVFGQYGIAVVYTEDEHMYGFWVAETDGEPIYFTSSKNIAIEYNLERALHHAIGLMIDETYLEISKHVAENLLNNFTKRNKL